MKNKINITELLADCPKGMELYSPIFGKVYLDKIRSHLGIVVTIGKEQGDIKEEFLYDGRYGINGECMLYPSKDKTTWEGFIPPCKFKDGDVIYTNNFIVILSNITEIGTVWYHCYYHIHTKRFKAKHDCGVGNINSDEFRLATEEEKQTLFQAIKDNGYRWNFQAKRLEKLIVPNFRKGDKVRVKKGVSEPRIIEDICDTFYTLVPIGKIDFTDQDNWELVPNKFDITTLKHFDKVLVRVCDTDKWIGDFYMWYNNTQKEFPYYCVNSVWSQCIPYEGNEHLCGTTNNCDEFYKNWENLTK